MKRLPDLLRQLPVCLVFQTLLDFQGPVLKIAKQLRAELKTNNTRKKGWGRLLRSSGAFQVKITMYARNNFYVIKMLKETHTVNIQRGSLYCHNSSSLRHKYALLRYKHASMSPVRAQASLLPRYINRDLHIQGRGRLRGGDLFDFKFFSCISY